MSTIGEAEFYTDDAEQVRRCKEALVQGREITEVYDTSTGDRLVTGKVTSVHEEIGPKWRITIKPRSDPS
jgi:hypothetical protein